MSLWERELQKAVWPRNNLAKFKSILASGEGKDLGRDAWKAGEAPLHEAAFWGRDQMVRLLVEAGANVNSFAEEDTRGDRWTALHWAAYGNHSSTVRLLLELGADRTLRGKWEECAGLGQEEGKRGHRQVAGGEDLSAERKISSFLSLLIIRVIDFAMSI
jgi:hypothetical protein